MMASPKRTWLWVVLGVMATLALVVVALVGGAVYEFRRHVRTETVESSTAEQEFERQMRRFAGQQPLIELVGRDRDDEPTIHRPPANAPRVQIQTLRVLIYDLNEGRLIHADIPGWMLRALPSSRFGAVGDEFERRRLTIDDLERHGLGLVLTGRNYNTRILMWTE